MDASKTLIVQCPLHMLMRPRESANLLSLNYKPLSFVLCVRTDKGRMWKTEKIMEEHESDSFPADDEELEDDPHVELDREHKQSMGWPL